MRRVTSLAATTLKEPTSCAKGAEVIMSTTTHDLVFHVTPAPAAKPSPIWEVIEMVGDAFAPAPASSHVERVEGLVYKVLIASAILVTSYGLFVAG
jgi:hypothetical protein